MCTNRLLGTQFANKIVKVTSDLLLQGAVSEYETLAGLHHPSIVGVFGLSLEETTQKASLVMEFLPGQSLSQLLREGRIFDGRTYIEIEVKAFALQLLSALLYLDSKGFVHGDINPANIILSKIHATIIDFQTVCAFSLAGPHGVTGTPPYQAPEMWFSAVHGSKVDVWALGLVLARLMRSSVIPMSVAGVELLAWCLQSEPLERCSAAQALGCSWFYTL